MEHKDLWPVPGEVPDDDDYLVPLGKARLAREGDDVTIVTWSRMVGLAEVAADLAAADGVSVEVVDLRTLWPWDKDCVLGSIEKTGRLLIAQESVQVGGFGAEIAATMAEERSGALKAPIRRLGAPRAPISYAKPLEDRVRVTPEAMAAAAKELAAA
jgi:pyruvate dehydrogenase E1 component beta subunit